MLKNSLQAVTLGCSKNRVDTEHILAHAEKHYDILPESETCADIVLVNTCGFIGDAKEESIAAIFAAVARKQAGNVGKVVVFGCLSERYADEIPGLIPEVDAWFGARDFSPLMEYLGIEPTDETSRRLTTPAHYAFLKIAEGCDRRCSYCAIPYIRGRHRSVPIEILVEEARCLATKGVKELIVISQDTTYYGLDIYHRRALAELLQRLSEVDGIEWIRVHYSYPADFPEDVLVQMAENPKICRYMDIPLQHISDKVLSNMHRGIGSEGTKALVDKMREKVPGLVLRTTMIVGHPGEGRREFKELLDFISTARFERLGAFEYSEEDGTWGAENLKDNVPVVEKRRRLDELMELQSGISLDFNRSRVGTVVKVIVDGVEDGCLQCRSEFESPEVDGLILVKVPETLSIVPELLIGAFIDVRITDCDEYDLFGEKV